jgi:hypothetical protein
LDPDCWEQNERVTREENEKLAKPFSMRELKEVVFSMETNTTPGPDHIPVEFFQSRWDIIKDDLFGLLLEFSRHELDIGRLNYGVIALIPKIKDASKIRQYRPICLLNVNFKIRCNKK